MFRLGDIADVLVGATPSMAREPATYLRMSDIGEAGIARSWGAEAPAPSRGADIRLRTGDVVVRSKGRELAAALVHPVHSHAYPSADLYVVRLRTKEVDPGYLVALIRSPSAQQQLSAAVQGSGLVRLNREGLARLSIPCPPLEVQARIGQLAADAEAEIKIFDELRGLRSRLHTELLQRALEKARAEDGNPRQELTQGPADASAEGSPIHPGKQKGAPNMIT